MKKLEECARAVVPHICRATQDCDSEQDARDLREAREIARAVIRCLMEPSEGMIEAGEDRDAFGGRAPAEIHFVAMLQSVLDESKE